MFSLKFIVFSLKFIVFSSKFIMFSSKFIMFSSKFIVFSSKFIMFYSNVCSDSGEHFTTSKICKSICVLLKRTLCDYPKSASLLVFYSGEHFTTLWNWQVYLCSTQENTLRLSNICKSICVILRRTLYNYPKLICLHVFYSGEHFTTLRNWHVYMCSTQENTLQLPNICMSTCVLLPRRTLHNYPISASLFVYRTLHSKSSILVTSP